MTFLVLLSGPVAVGKSAVARELIAGHRFQSIRSGSYLAGLAVQQGHDRSRAALQKLGDELDKKTDYRWLIDEVTIAALQQNPSHVRWLLDSVRKKRQIEHFRTQFEDSVFHVHLTAPKSVLPERYTRRLSAGGEYSGNTSYDAAIAHPNETSARSLIDIADLVIDVSQTLSSEAAARVVTQLSGKAKYATGHPD